jgi:hypothetical protein
MLALNPGEGYFLLRLFAVSGRARPWLAREGDLEWFFKRVSCSMRVLALDEGFSQAVFVFLRYYHFVQLCFEDRF